MFSSAILTAGEASTAGVLLNLSNCIAISIRGAMGAVELLSGMRMIWWPVGGTVSPRGARLLAAAQPPPRPGAPKNCDDHKDHLTVTISPSPSHYYHLTINIDISPSHHITLTISPSPSLRHHHVITISQSQSRVTISPSRIHPTAATISLSFPTSTADQNVAL